MSDITDPMKNIIESIQYARSAYGWSDAAEEFKRRRHPDKIIEPTEKDWELYRAAQAALDAAAESDFIYIDGGIEPPCSRREPGDYSETEDEYRSRANALAAEKGIPEDIHRALSMAEWRILVEEE